MRRLHKIIKTAFVVVFAALTLSAVSSAATFTAMGSDADGALSASAVITAGNGTIIVTLTNLLGAETSIGQALSDLSFTITGASGTPTYSGGSLPDGAVDISGSGVTSASPSSSASQGFGWNLSRSGTEITLDGLGGGQPTDLIVGSGPYGAGGNPGTGGFNPHNPSLVTTATFDLNVAGVTSSSVISNVNFSFGTGPEANLPGTPSPVPEPGSILLLGTVFALTGGTMARRARKDRTPIVQG